MPNFLCCKCASELSKEEIEKLTPYSRSGRRGGAVRCKCCKKIISDNLRNLGVVDIVFVQGDMEFPQKKEVF